MQRKRHTRVPSRIENAIGSKRINNSGNLNNAHLLSSEYSIMLQDPGKESPNDL